ncbi:MAG: ABC transporter ATP-binding protein [Deltaproteobacteria bacterium]|nr:ABC transporter ATP-binding protein [Deltaproteobacteria bacterium]
MSLELREVKKSFPGEEPGSAAAIIDGVSLSIPTGRFVALVGPSGCGKTTLLRIVAGLEKATAGEILLDGQPMARHPERVGMVFQQYALFPWRTAQKNIETGLEIKGVPAAERRRAAREYVAAFGLEGAENRYPHQLSGGMQQRVAIARTLIMEPRVVLMDEPFGSLDSQTRNSLQEFLLKVWQQRGDTIIFVTHNVDEAVFLADDIAVFSPRPARLVGSFPVNEPRPRDRTSPACNAIRRQVLGLLHQGGHGDTHGTSAP